MIPRSLQATFAKPGVVLRRPVGSDGRVQRTCRAAEGPTHRQGGRRGQQSLERRQKNRRLRRSTTKQHARPPLRWRENGSGAIASAGRKRPRGRRNASGASRQSQRLKQRLKKRSVTMKPRSKKSTETAPHSTDGRKRRTRAGKSRRTNWTPLCAGRATSHVAMSQDGTTAIGTWSPRARAGFPIAAPVGWRQIESGIRPDAVSMEKPPRR